MPRITISFKTTNDACKFIAKACFTTVGRSVVMPYFSHFDYYQIADTVTFDTDQTKEEIEALCGELKLKYNYVSKPY